MEKLQSKWFKAIISFFIVVIGGLTFCLYQQHQRFQKQAHVYSSHPLDAQKLDTCFHRVVDPSSQDRWLEQFVLDFPYNDYRIYQVPRLASFYVDEMTDVIKGFIVRGKIHEPHNVELIRRYALKGSTVLDIGAHIGTMTFPMSQAVGSKGRVISFEPQPKIFRELVMNIYRNKVDNVHLFWAAVGATDGTIELTPMEDGNEGGTRLGGGGTGKFVSLRTIDSFHFENVSLIKIDVEGMEESVLEGAKNTILQNKPVILVEICGGTDFDTASFETRAVISHTIGMVEDWGYSVQKIHGHDYLALPKHGASL